MGVQPLATPDDVALATFDAGSDPQSLILPSVQRPASEAATTTDATGLAAGALTYHVTLQPGETRTVGWVSQLSGDALAALGVEIDRRRILMDAPIRTLGEHPVRVRLHPSVLAVVPVKVVSDQQSFEEEPAPKASAEVAGPAE